MADKTKVGILLTMFLLFTLINSNPQITNANSINPVPIEDPQIGKNSNAYLPVFYPSTQMKKDFVNEISQYAIEANKKWGIPASAIIGMAMIESGYGTTRIAINANNIFGIKVWGYSPSNAWQLQGQPDEDYEAIPVIANYGADRKIYDESKRRDNWYRAFDSYKGAVDYLAGGLLLNQRYRFAKTNYDERLKSGWSFKNASKYYLYDIANAGYNHLGGEYYKNKVGLIMDQWDLYQFDDERKFIDIGGHWAKNEILFLAEKGWINGYPNRTYKPNGTLTRAEAAEIIRNFLALTSTNESISFKDVRNESWASEPISLVAQHNIMNGTGEGYFSPDAILTRAQMAQTFYNAGFYSESATNELNSFADVGEDYWAYIAIETMKQEGIMTGYPDNQFGPNDPITRGQMAAVIYRIHSKGLDR
ncbi:S-layer homology domain-containing protein [Ureibacillus acetophenoni]|uniref:Flagellum-specific peptidoglycan hydrolase FlgJ n=1 Tax=Ureibacillus acetophenoni TaxID=614649 RepID=A0A285UN14_9BACL|nr:S-layer homology domain-containing protein [Ureibacillus acetophenoni]SOC43202.1 flagellum-specific peptidoglycan hydrolase FlgJ [Ureibacillus acetophenoni]